MKVVLVASGKGGTGKTTVTVNLGKVMSVEHRVGILDLDVTGPNVPRMLGLSGDGHELCDEEWFYPVKYNENLEVFSPSFLFPADVACAWSGDKRRELIHELILKVKWDNPDIILCDSPPGTSDEIIAVLKYMPKIDGAIIVTNSKKVSADDAKRLLALLTNRMYEVNVLGVIDNMSYMKIGSRYQSLFSDQVDLSEELGVNVLARIPFSDAENLACELRGAAELIIDLIGGLP